LLAQAGAEDVKRHKWFKGVDWEDVYYRFVTFFNFNFIFIIVITVHQGVDLGFLSWVLSPTSQKKRAICHRVDTTISHGLTIALATILPHHPSEN
jgi:hypothetical protein